ncbi:tripartite tricarboxylate transporter TctB family protein [Halomonas sp. 86]|uniref:tripartite tricarboxylate transporter TctB family protein n=1 Tax=unclassified Halomonas TaxID=2609666 RepID=UPI00403324C0
MSKHLSDLVGGVIFFGLTLLFWLQTTGQPAVGQDMANNPFWYPRVLLILMGLASLLLIGKGMAKRSEQGERIKLPFKSIRLWAGVGLIALFLLAFDSLGFLPSALLLVPLFCFSMGYRNYVVVAVFTLVFVPLIWLVFTYGFSIRPPGVGLDTVLEMIAGGTDG